MCLIIDTCCLAKVFNKDNIEHDRFKPVLDWITKGQGSVIYGGGKYKRELRRAPKYLSILVELNRQGRVISLSDKEVDVIAEEVSSIVNRSDFDDEHLIAIVRVACCRVVCTDDKTAERYLKRSDLYPRGMKKPKIYKNVRQKTLCCKRYVVGKCMERLDQRR